MGSNTIEEAKKWLRQRQPVPDRVASLIMRCAEGGMKPSQIRMSTDMFTQIAKAAAKTLGKDFDPEDLPKALGISLGDHELKIIHDEEMPRASMHAKK